MDDLFIRDRAALNDATDLLRHFGEEAGAEARLRAAMSREAENVRRFCHWRQIERVVAVLESHEAKGTLH